MEVIKIDVRLGQFAGFSDFSPGYRASQGMYALTSYSEEDALKIGEKYTITFSMAIPVRTQFTSRHQLGQPV